MAVPSKLAYEKRYDDDSSVEYGVSYNENDKYEIGLEQGGDRISFPLSQIDWFIESLLDIKEQVIGSEPVKDTPIYGLMVCVNKIDDYLEYRYKSDDKEIIKKTILTYLEEFTINLKEGN